MFEVRGIPILESEINILKELKRQVYEQQGKEILRKIKKSGDNIMICCPEHSNGQERRPSCGVSIVPVGDRPAGTVHCFACGYVDTLEGMISKCFGHYEDDSFGRKWLLENFVTGDVEERPNIMADFSRDVPKKKEKLPFVTEEELSKYREFYHDYMWKRKLTKEVVDKYDVGYQKDFVLKTVDDEGNEKEWPPVECLTFPCRDKDGNVLFVSRRAIYNKNFFLPTGIEKPVYGIYELPKGCDEVIICESVFNALTCVSYGRPAVALFGTGDQNQYDILNSLPVRKYILGLDPDKAGNKGTWKLKRQLKNKIISKLIIPNGKDINDLSYEEFWSLPEVFV